MPAAILENNLKAVSIRPLCCCEPTILERGEFFRNTGIRGNACVYPYQDGKDNRQEDCSRACCVSGHRLLIVLAMVLLGKAAGDDYFRQLAT